MQNNEIEFSISNFYKNNSIKYEQYTDNRDIHYSEGLDLDTKIYKPNLKMALNEWLQNFDEKDRKYYLKMFEHFTYLTQRNFDCKVYYLKKYIFESLSECHQDKILIVFSESKKGYKSGASEMSTAWWKACNGEMRKSQLIEVCSKVEIEDLIEMDAIVFADDIVATGFTLKATIEDFFSKFPYEKFVHTKFYATGVIATKRGERIIKKLPRKGIDITWLYNQEYIVQAFKGEYIFKGNEVNNIENVILNYEKKIGSDNDGKSYIMGFEASKLLIGFHYEIPNNTMCTFWRYGEEHVPLFERSSNQKISLEAIRARKKMMTDNAYRMKSIEE